MTIQQSDIFRNDTQQLHYAELCNALYERELSALAQSPTQNIDNLKRRLGGLSYHIKNAATFLLNHQAPLEVDLHNASWQGKQSAKSILNRESAEKSSNWFAAHAHFGMPVAVCIDELGLHSLELDSIDRIDKSQQRIHLNKHGWFSFAGINEEQNDKIKKSLLVPSKISLSAACCGHGWNHSGRTPPRALSLREILLSSKINWQNFKKPL
ncbi:hypothetical protein QX776_03950 [Alteromonadaceae bacterium BrNp21-10]|nr:hypothetical protein [Alteromonadaceae bacterium BrNp21-10]